MIRICLLGEVGSGKTTIFKLFTRGKIVNPPHPNIARVDFFDARVDYLFSVLGANNKVYEKIEFVDPPGFTKSSMSICSTCDVLAYIIPYFGEFNKPIEEAIKNLENEIILRDLSICDAALEKSKAQENEELKKCKKLLENGIPLRNKGIDEKILNNYNFLTHKPRSIIINTDKKMEENEYTVVDAKLELEISELSDEERKEYEKEFGFYEPPINRFIKKWCNSFNITTFFTVVHNEVRAWHVKKGATIIESASKIHSDMAKGFIRAEVINFNLFKEVGSMKLAKEKGLISTVDRNYVVQDGDIIEIKFKV